MLKKTLIILVIVGIIFTSLSLLRIEKQKNIKNTIQSVNPIRISKIRNILKEEKPIGTIIIPKINVEKPLYDKESNKNNIEKNITILKESKYPDQENSIIYIAAHSGTGKVAFFEKLDELDLKDEIIIEYKNIEYKYIINNIYEQRKDGYIQGRVENTNQLVLTTCCPKKENCQLIINSIKIES